MKNMHTLTPQELYNAMGFPPDYIIDPTIIELRRRVGQGRPSLPPEPLKNPITLFQGEF